MTIVVPSKEGTVPEYVASRKVLKGARRVSPLAIPYTWRREMPADRFVIALMKMYVQVRMTKQLNSWIRVINYRSNYQNALDHVNMQSHNL